MPCKYLYKGKEYSEKDMLALIASGEFSDVALTAEQLQNVNEPLLAPNGKPSNLTPEQYRQVRTPEFKAWFGDWENDPVNASKVVDENGEPLVVYHGTPYKGFDEFKYKGLRDTGNSFLGIGFYFTKSKSQASSFTGIPKSPFFGFNATPGLKRKKGVYSVFLNVRNPLVVADVDAEKLILLVEGSRKANGGKGPLSEEIKQEIRRKLPEEQGYRKERFISDYSSLSALARQNGYDGVIGMQEEAILVPEPTQIKSATDNIGTFDPTNPNINLSIGQNPKQVILDRIRADKNVQEKLTAQELFSVAKDRFEKFGVTLQDILDVYNTGVPPASTEPADFARTPPPPVEPPKPPTAPTPSVASPTKGSFEDITTLKGPELKEIFNSGETLEKYGLPKNIRDFTPEDPSDATQLRFEVGSVVITGQQFVDKAIELYGPDTKDWVPQLVAYANSSDILRRNIILTHLVDYLLFDTVGTDPALIRSVQRQWRIAGSITSEAFNARRALKHLRDIREGTLIQDSGVIARFQKQMDELQRMLDNADDADLNTFEDVIAAESAETVSDSVYKPTAAKQVRGKNKSINKQKKSVADKDALIARMKQLQEGLKVRC